MLSKGAAADPFVGDSRPRSGRSDDRRNDARARLGAETGYEPWRAISRRFTYLKE
jgi:hypothetical protein